MDTMRAPLTMRRTYHAACPIAGGYLPAHAREPDQHPVELPREGADADDCHALLRRGATTAVVTALPEAALTLEWETR